MEAKSLDMLRETITRASDDGAAKSRERPGRKEELMDYLLDICMNVIQERSLRNEVTSYPEYSLLSVDTLADSAAHT